MAPEFARDRLTWVAYAVLAWFAVLQASPGLVITQLREELGFGYWQGGLHVAAFAAGSTLAGLLSSRLEGVLGRGPLLWSAAALMGSGVIVLTAGHVVEVTVGAILVMGVGGGVVLATIQATLADHHAERRTVALAEANVAASVAYLALVGAFAVAAWLQLGWRTALLASLVVPAAVWWCNRHLPIATTTDSEARGGRLPGAFWAAALLLVCATAAEWCITAWGASLVEATVDVSPNTAVSLMAGYFGGIVAGRVLGSRLARRHDPALLLACALGIAATGFAILWPSGAPAPAFAGLVLLGVGLGNLFPMGISLAVALAPGRSAQASGRAVALTSFAVLIAPLTVGAVADATSLHLALAVVPVLLVVAAAGLGLVVRARAAVVRRAPIA